MWITIIFETIDDQKNMLSIWIVIIFDFVYIGLENMSYHLDHHYIGFGPTWITIILGLAEPGSPLYCDWLTVYTYIQTYSIHIHFTHMCMHELGHP